VTSFIPLTGGQRKLKNCTKSCDFSVCLPFVIGILTSVATWPVSTRKETRGPPFEPERRAYQSGIKISFLEALEVELYRKSKHTE